MNKKICVICRQDNYIIKKSPCKTCENVYIHTKCLDEYFQYVYSNKCFVCNQGTIRSTLPTYNTIIVNVQPFNAVSHESYMTKCTKCLTQWLTRFTTKCSTCLTRFTKMIVMIFMAYGYGCIPTFLILSFYG